jgi:hypothetical protein
LGGVFDGFHIAAGEVVVAGSDISDVPSRDHEQSGSARFVTIQLGELGVGVIDGSAEGECVDGR